ncbi:MAG: transcriptional repressor [Myxococcaceae bacterium]|nr:transcriptional repressor [Myxococcaceae bacterium]
MRARKAAPVATVDVLRSTIRGAGLRSTAPRLAVLKRLMGAGTPVSHSELYDELAREGMDRTTVYRNLVDLTDAGLVERTDLGDHVWRFELKRLGEGPKVDSHAHFTCTDCGTVACLDDVEVKVRAGRAPRAVARRKVEVQLRGLCDDCG